MDRLQKQELLVSTAAWVVAFLFLPLPVVLPFFVLFIIHYFALLPIIEKNRVLYLVLTLILLAAFAVFCLTVKHVPPKVTDPDLLPPEGLSALSPGANKILIGVFIVLVSLGLRSSSNLIRSERRMKELQTENMVRQLEALRYQINPHFFMNTLNNIHALVDIDPEKAKESIEEFAKMMRIVLYDGNTPTIPLAKEVEYLGHYISLMRLRYPSDVSISASFPEDCSGISVPPLLFASFVENAFKHGISYEHESFVHVSIVKDDGKLIFRCANSRIPGTDPVKHGIGTENTRKRLQLLYGNDYTFNVDEGEKVYDIILILPA